MELPRNLSELRARLLQEAQDVSLEQALEIFAGLVGPDIKIRYELPPQGGRIQAKTYDGRRQSDHKSGRRRRSGRNNRTGGRQTATHPIDHSSAALDTSKSFQRVESFLDARPYLASPMDYRASDYTSDQSVDYSADHESDGPSTDSLCSSQESDSGVSVATRRYLASPTDSIVPPDISLCRGTMRPSRIILTTVKNRADFSRDLAKQCKGVVFLFPSWNVIALPAPMFIPTFSKHDLISNFDDFGIYEVKDGTTVTLYWCENYADIFDTRSTPAVAGKWCLSSVNGFDVSNYKWMGPLTYMEAFMASCKQYDFSFDRLNKSYSYTIGFRHLDFHPLLTDPPKMWLIQIGCGDKIVGLNATGSATCFAANTHPAGSIDIVSPIVEWPGVIGCDGAKNPRGTTNDINDTNIGIPPQTRLKFNVSAKKAVALMYERGNAALHNYIESKSADHIHYGYVFRSAHGTGHNSYVLGSELLKSVKNLMYDLPKQRGTAITPTNRAEYAALRAYLGFGTRSIFVYLFPQLFHLHKQYTATFAKLLSGVLAILRYGVPLESPHKARTNKHNGPRYEPSELEIRTAKLAPLLANYINRSGISLDTFNEVVTNAVRDFITHPNHLDLYHGCLFTD